MPRIKTNRTNQAPDGFDKIKPTLDDFELRLREIHEKKDSRLSTKANENLWKIIQINHERSHYIYKLFYKRKAISRELYDWLLKEKYADKFLIAKWKKKGYEKLCCLRCIQSDETNRGKTCICRVPRIQLEEDAESRGTEVTLSLIHI